MAQMKRLAISRRSEAFPASFRSSIERNAFEFINDANSHLFVSSEELLLRKLNFDNKKSAPMTLADIIDPKNGSGSFCSACYHACIVGTEGIGKTTLLSSFVQNALSGGIAAINPKVDLVHVINCHSFDPNERLTLAEFLFGSIKGSVSNEDMCAGINCIKEGSTNATFVLDGLDTVPYKVEGRATLFDRHTPGAILQSLLEGLLFTECNVLSSISEENLDKFLSNAKNRFEISKMVFIEGLSPASICRIASEYLGDVLYKESFVHLKKVSPYLMSMCGHPTLLLMTLCSLQEGNEDENESLPKGISGVMARLLVKMSEIKSNAFEMLERLKRAAYVVKSKDEKCFSSRRLEEAEIDEEDIRCHFWGVEKFQLFQNPLKYSKNLKFAHPILLDSFCALYISESDFLKFEQITSKRSKDPRFARVVRLICGFVMEEKTFQKTLELYPSESQRITRITNDRPQKLTLLKNLLKTELVNMVEGEIFELKEQFNIFHTLAESGWEAKEIIFHNFKEYEMCRFGCLTLRGCDMCALAISICCRTKLDRLVLTDTGLPTALLESLHRNIMSMKASIEIKLFYFDVHPCVADENDSVAISRFLVHVTELCYLRGWRFDSDGKAHLQKKLDFLQAFDLKVNINDVDVLTAKSTWCDIIQDDITPQGGSMELNDCSLTFKSASFDRTAKVVMEMQNSAKVYPDEYLLMSPCIDVAINADLRRAVFVSLAPWCVRDEDKDDQSLQFTILHQDNESETWTAIDNVNVKNKSIVEFQCKSFSTIAVAIKKIYASLTRVRLTAFICCKSNCLEWCITFCIDHKSIVKETEEELRRHGYKQKHLPLNTMRAKVGDKLSVDLKVRESEFLFDLKKNKLVFHLTQRFIKNRRRENFTFLLRKKTTRKGPWNITVDFSSWHNDKSVPNDEGVFLCEVPNADSVSGRSERLEDAFEYIQPRFASGDQFRKFAMSKDGFGLSLHEISVSREDNRNNRFDCEMDLMQRWKAKQGGKATAENLHNLVDNYFGIVPVASKDDRLKLDDRYADAMSDFKTYNDWYNFATSDPGLSLSKSFVDRLIDQQENITRAQKQEMLNEWEQKRNGNVSFELFHNVVSSYKEKNGLD